MKWNVWYCKEPTFQKNYNLTVDNLSETHVLLREVEAENIDAVYYEMQGEIWSPKGEARELLQKLGLQHTSMSVGDVVECQDCGDFHQCDPLGWSKIPTQATKDRLAAHKKEVMDRITKRYNVENLV